MTLKIEQKSFVVDLNEPNLHALNINFVDESHLCYRTLIHPNYGSLHEIHIKSLVENMLDVESIREIVNCVSLEI